MTDLFDFAAAKRDPRIAAFEEFHAANPQVYEAFKRFAREAKSKVARYSSDAILHRIRWFSTIETNDPSWKINDHWSAFYARMLIRDDPSFTGFFELRRAVADKEAA